MPHVNMDGDALGSALAMHQVLQCLGKEPYIYSTDEVASIYRFLPRLNNVCRELPDREFDCAILLECPNYKRSPAGDSFRARVQVNVDHHPDNLFYADLNWVDTETSSVGEILFGLFEELDYPIPPEAVLNLYVAIFTDTGAFQYSKTTHKTHWAIAKMLKSTSIPMDEVGRRIYRELDLNVMKLLGRLMLKAQVYPEGFAVVTLPKDLMEEYGVSDADAHNLVRDLDVIRGVHTMLFIRETSKGQTKVSLRSSLIPVNTVAARFGGGGHERASGCTLSMPLEETEVKFMDAIREKILSGERLPV
jgi:phosphoesterase RecJ-like protein